VFNREKTAKYRDIFEDVHKGRLNLREIIGKANAYDMTALPHSPGLYRRVEHGQTGVNISQAEVVSKLDELKGAIERQEKAVMKIDERGIHATVSRIESKQKIIRSKAR
jgi:hypothetical protein